MAYLAVVLALTAGGFAGATVILGRWLGQANRQAARREARAAAQIEDLVNRTMYLVEKPWTAPPDSRPVAPQENGDRDIVYLPEQTVIQEP